MEGEDALRSHEFDVADEVGVVGVVGEGKGGVALEAEGRAGRERPAGEHGGAAVFDARDHEGAGGAGRADEHFSGGLAGGVGQVAGGEIGTQRAVDFGHFENRAVEHRGEAGGEEGAEDFLGLAERVAEEHGHRAVVEGVAAESGHLGEDFGGGRHAVFRQAVGRLHDEGVGVPPLRGLGGEAGAQFEIAGVEERAGVRLDEGLRGAEDVARWQKRDREVAERAPFAELQKMLAPHAAEPRLHEPGGAGAGDDFLVRGDVVGVCVGDKGEGARVPRVEPEAVRGEREAAVVADGNHAVNRIGAECVEGRKRQIRAAGMAGAMIDTAMQRRLLSAPK